MQISRQRGCLGVSLMKENAFFSGRMTSIVLYPFPSINVFSFAARIVNFTIAVGLSGTWIG
jgi:hypothetical protein